MEIKTIFKEEEIEKEILYKNGRIKHFLYYRCKEFIICRDLMYSDCLAIFTYPSMKCLVNKFKKLKEKKAPEFDWNDLFIFS